MLARTRLVILCLFLTLMGAPHLAKADLFGGDVAVLSQILVQAIQQLARLRELVSTADNQFELIRQINQGINDSLTLLKTIDPNLDPGIYKEWNTVNESLRKVSEIYGAVPDSPDSRVQRDADQSVAEAVTFNNSFYKYSENNDAVGERIKEYSHSVSPGGAQKLTAQALGVVIQGLNQSLRAQSTGLKLQAQQLAIENRREKAETRQYVENSENLRTALKAQKVRFDIPRF